VSESNAYHFVTDCRVRLLTKGWLPYTLRWELAIEVRLKPDPTSRGAGHYFSRSIFIERSARSQPTVTIS